MVRVHNQICDIVVVGGTAMAVGEYLSKEPSSMLDRTDRLSTASIFVGIRFVIEDHLTEELESYAPR